MAEVELIIDSIRQSLMNDQKVVILKEKDAERYIPIWISPFEANAIEVTLQGINMTSPLTHDFLLTIIDIFHATFQRVVLNDLVQDIYHAKVILKYGDSLIDINCRPSDALAVAVRAKAPIFADEKVLKEASISDTNEIKRKELSGILKPEKEVKSEMGTSLEFFSPSATYILTKSEAQAKHREHDFVGTGHLLVALANNESKASKILEVLGIDFDPKWWSDDLIGNRKLESAKTGLSPNMKEVIKLSISEATELGSKEVLPEHLLLGIVGFDNGAFSKLLKKRGVSKEKIYKELIRLSS